jgi:glycosyltransferase involved in cell wall biosynthesis
VVAIATKPNVHVSGITAILEAMACGKAVIASHTEGMQDYVSHNVNGVLVPPGNPDALAEAIGDLLRDPARAQALGAAGRQSVEAIFNTREQARRLADIVS